MVVLDGFNKLYVMSVIMIPNSVIKYGSRIVSILLPVSAEITNADPDKVAITFDQALLDTSVPATSAFALSGKTISNVAIVGAVVTLTVTVAYSGIEVVTVNYTKPGSNQLKALVGGGQVASFIGLSVSNNILDVDTLTYITGAITPLSSARLAIVDTFVRAIKTGLSISLLSDFFDTMYLRANETSEFALRNLVKRSHDSTLVNTPTFTADEGFTGAATKAINNNYNPRTDGVKYTLNQCSMGVYYISDDGAGGKSSGLGDGTQRIMVQLQGAATSYGVANGINDYIALVATTIDGLWIIGRNGIDDSHQYMYYKKTDVTNVLGAPAGACAIPNGDLHELAFNGSGVLASFETGRQIAFSFTGGNVSTAQRDIIVDAFAAYFAAL